MSTVQTYCSNGVSFGARYTIPATAATAPATVLFDFMPSGTVDGYNLAAVITVTNSAGVITSGADVRIEPIGEVTLNAGFRVELGGEFEIKSNQ